MLGKILCASIYFYKNKEINFELRNTVAGLLFHFLQKKETDKGAEG